MCISTTCMSLVFFTLTAFMLVLILEVQKGCNGVMVLLILACRIISVIRTIHLPKQPSGQKGSVNQGYTLITRATLVAKGIFIQAPWCALDAHLFVSLVFTALFQCSSKANLIASTSRGGLDTHSNMISHTYVVHVRFTLDVY